MLIMHVCSSYIVHVQVHVFIMYVQVHVLCTGTHAQIYICIWDLSREKGPSAYNKKML